MFNFWTPRNTLQVISLYVSVFKCIFRWLKSSQISDRCWPINQNQSLLPILDKAGCWHFQLFWNYHLLLMLSWRGIKVNPWSLVRDTIWEARLLVGASNAKKWLWWYRGNQQKKADWSPKNVWMLSQQRSMSAVWLGKWGHLYITFTCQRQQSDFYLCSTRL